jgi:hypothetical protein
MDSSAGALSLKEKSPDTVPGDANQLVIAAAQREKDQLN